MIPTPKPTLTPLEKVRRLQSRTHTDTSGCQRRFLSPSSALNKERAQSLAFHRGMREAQCNLDFNDPDAY